MKSLLSILLLCPFLQAGVALATSPNFVLIYTDDQGWLDTSVEMMSGRVDSKGKLCRTPNLERLAGRGMTFSNGYACSPVCSSSRDSLLFGKTPARLHHSILMGKARHDPSDWTIPRAIKAVHADYVCAHLGKWDSTPTPKAAGFDLGEAGSNGTGDDASPDNPKRIFSLARKANEFIEKQAKAGKPFYLRVSHYAIHNKHFARPETLRTYKEKGLDDRQALRLAMIEDLDAGFGLLLDKLDSLGLSKSTFVIFTSDNGAQGSNLPLRGGKAWAWEGGLRVPLIVSGPGVPKRSRCDLPVVGWDFLPTFFELAGGDARNLPKELDGGSLAEVLRKGNKGKVSRGEQSLVFHYPWFVKVPMSSVRLGKHKLVRDLRSGTTRLFDLSKDIGESNDLTARLPEVSEDLKARLDKYLEEVGAETLKEVLEKNERESLAKIEVWRAQADKLLSSLKDAPEAERKKRTTEAVSLEKRILQQMDSIKRMRANRRTAW